MKIKESGSGDKILWLFVAVGAAIFLAGAALGIVFIVQSAEYDETTAVITRIEEYRDSDGERARDVFVRYTYGGVEYEDIELSWWESGMREGDEITVLCRRDDPSVTRSETLVVVLPLIYRGVQTRRRKYRSRLRQRAVFPQISRSCGQCGDGVCPARRPFGLLGGFRFRRSPRRSRRGAYADRRGEQCEYGERFAGGGQCGRNARGYALSLPRGILPRSACGRACRYE